MCCSNFKILACIYLIFLIPDLITLIYTLKGSKHEPFYVDSLSDKNKNYKDYAQLYDKITISKNNNFMNKHEYLHKTINFCHKIKSGKKNLRVLLEEKSYVNKTWCKEINDELMNGNKSFREIFPIKKDSLKNVHSMATGLLVLLALSGGGIIIIASFQNIIFIGEILLLIIDLILFIVLWINFNKSGVRKYLDFLDCENVPSIYRHYEMENLGHTELFIPFHIVLLIVRFIYTICYNVKLMKNLNINVNEDECFIAIILFIPL